MSEKDPEDKKKATSRMFSTDYRMMELIEKLNQRVEDNAEKSQHQEEETQRKIDFIIQQQAQFVTNIQELRDAQAKTDNVVNRLATLTLNRFERVDDEASNLESKMSALVDSHIKLADAQKNTDERLNSFINTVERLISEGRNGK